MPDAGARGGGRGEGPPRGTGGNPGGPGRDLGQPGGTAGGSDEGSAGVVGGGGAPIGPGGGGGNGTPAGLGGLGGGGRMIGSPKVPGVAGRKIEPGGAIGEVAVGPGSLPAVPGLLQTISAPLAGPSEIPVGRPISPIFNIGGAPIAVLGGVFQGGLPIGGPVPQIFRGGSAPIPPTLFVATISPSGPIGAFLLGGGGAPIGVLTFGGGGLPIGAEQAIARAVAAIQPRTALVGAPAVAFGGGQVAGPVSPIGVTAGARPGGAPSG